VTKYRNRRVRVLSLLVASALAVAACGGAKVGGGSSAAPTTTGSATGTSTAKPCGTVNIAVNPWVGYEADAAVVGYLLKTKLGCNVVDTALTEQVSWQGFATGQIDVVLENWGHPELVAKYITAQHVAVDFGPDGNQGIIGWYVPKWMADQYPDITNWKNLNKYAALFKTPESGSLGQLLDGDPSYVTVDAALVKNLNLNYKVVVGGSEATLIKSLETATTQKKALLFYFYEPQWALANLKVARITLPPYTTGCDADPKKVACDYPPYVLNKVVSVKFANSGSPAVAFIKNFTWTNADQNQVAEYIANENMTDAAAAQKWVDANPTKWAAWLAGS
jgi:glycine betaine/proline transport system substrate-binding protein